MRPPPAISLEAVTRLVEEAASEEVLPRFRRLERHEIETKSGPDDLVTAADVACERRLTASLTRLAPGSRVVGEEAVAQAPGLLGALTEPGRVWVVDPVDGTVNFARGDPSFAVIVALVEDGEVEAGWIHHPLAGKTVVGRRGGGAWRGRRRLRVAPSAPLEQMGAALYVGAKRTPELHRRLKALRPRLGPRTFARSAGLEYLNLVEGRIHYAVFTRQLPWDHAAGWLIHAEAGGHGAYLDREPYRPIEGAKPFLLAPDEVTWEGLRALMCGSEEEAAGR